MWKDEHFSLFVLITLLLDIASSLYLSKEAATKNVNETFVVICRDNAGLSVAWKGPKGRLGSKTHPNVQQGSFGTSIVFNKTRVGDTGNYTCTCAASRETRIFQLIVEEVSTTTQISTDSEPSTSLEISKNRKETNKLESNTGEAVEFITTFFNTYDIDTTTEEPIVHHTHRPKHHRKKPKNNKNALETNNIPLNAPEEYVESTTENTIKSNLFTTVEEPEMSPEIYVPTNHKQNHNEPNTSPNTPLEDFDFVDTPEFQAGVEGKPATLRCDVDRNNVDLSWSLANGEPLKNESKVINGGDGFIIKNVSREDANIYTCQALQRSSGTIKNRNINFTVHHKPYPLYAQENVVYGFLYEPLNLTCEVEANPAPTIWWNPGDVGSIVEKSSHKSVLQLNVTEATEGDYKCITSNKVGTFEKVFSVIIGVKPDPPQNVTLIAATPTSLEIWIQASNVSDDIVGTDMEPSILVIQYRPASKEDADWNEAKLNISVEAAIISDLEKNTKYEIRVATENSAGISEYYETVYETSLATSIHMKSSLVYLIMLLTSKFWLA